MGYDISFHPISEAQIFEWYFDVVDNSNKAREIAKKYSVDDEGDNFYENKYIDILDISKNVDADECFDETYGYYIANIQGIFQKFFYVRGASFSFIENSIMDKYYKKWEEFIPDNYKKMAIHNEIQNNYYSGKFIPYNMVCQLLDDYENNIEIKAVLDEQFSLNRIDILLEALNFAKESGVGLLESDGVMEPNPLELNDSTCYSNLFNCDIKGPLLYQEAAVKQIEALENDKNE